MKRFCLVVAGLILSGSVQAGEWVSQLDGTWTYEKSSKKLVTIPTGYHAHTTLDGRVVVHSDSNLGNADAHEGIAHPWPKSARAGQTVLADFVESPRYCPPGKSCPTYGGVWESAGSGVFNYVASPSTERVRETRNRPILKAVRGFLSRFRLRGGCN